MHALIACSKGKDFYLYRRHMVISGLWYSPLRKGNRGVPVVMIGRYHNGLVRENCEFNGYLMMSAVGSSRR